MHQEFWGLSQPFTRKLQEALSSLGERDFDAGCSLGRMSCLINSGIHLQRPGTPKPAICKDSSCLSAKVPSLTTGSRRWGATCCVFWKHSVILASQFGWSAGATQFFMIIFWAIKTKLLSEWNLILSSYTVVSVLLTRCHHPVCTSSCVNSGISNYQATLMEHPDCWLFKEDRTSRAR